MGCFSWTNVKDLDTLSLVTKSNDTFKRNSIFNRLLTSNTNSFIIPNDGMDDSLQPKQFNIFWINIIS